MTFKVGDKVLVLDEAMSGIIKKIDGNNISIETTDGFLLDFEKRTPLPVFVKDGAISTASTKSRAPAHGRASRTARLGGTQTLSA